MKLALVGAGLTAGLTGAAGLVWGGSAVPGALVFGALATALQMAATAAVRPALGGPFAELMRRWGVGMGLRLAGVVVLAIVLSLDRELFRPLPSALGYVGVLFPLMIVETRRLR